MIKFFQVIFFFIKLGNFFLKVPKKVGLEILQLKWDSCKVIKLSMIDDKKVKRMKVQWNRKWWLIWIIRSDVNFFITFGT